MAFIDVNELVIAGGSGGRILDRVHFSVKRNQKMALIGPNGSGKTTLLRALAGQISSQTGSLKTPAMVTYVPQQWARGTIGDLVLQQYPARIRDAYLRLQGSDFDALDYAQVLEDWEALGGYALQSQWDIACESILGTSFDRVAMCSVETIAQRQRKLLALQIALHSKTELLLLDEPDAALLLEDREGLDKALENYEGTVLFSSHDRYLLQHFYGRYLVFEPRRNGTVTWEFEGTLLDLPSKRLRRHEEITASQQLSAHKRERLERHAKDMAVRASYNDKMSSRSRAAKTRLEKFDAAQQMMYKREVRKASFIFNCSSRKYEFIVRCAWRGKPSASTEMKVHPGKSVGIAQPLSNVRIAEEEPRKPSTSSKVVQFEAVDCVTATFEIAFEERTNSGKRPAVGLFSQARGDWQYADQTVLDIVLSRCSAAHDINVLLNEAGLAHLRQSHYRDLSGGEQARLQLLLLGLAEYDLLILDEPTMHLDIESADALEEALANYQGVLLVATSDRALLAAMDTQFEKPAKEVRRNIP